MSFSEWLDTFVEEKQIDPYHVIEVEDPRDDVDQFHMVENNVVLEAAKSADRKEQQAIRNMLVKIDFRNGDVQQYLDNLAEGFITMRLLPKKEEETYG